MSRDFKQIIDAKWQEGKFLCVGIDPDIEKLPESIRHGDIREILVTFGRAIVDSTLDIVAAYKPNSAFYEAHGDEGYAALRETILYAQEKAPEVAIILDAKRADIGSTNAGYVDAVFEHLRADAITLHPYLGHEALAPFLSRKEKGIFVLCRTSNPGAGEFQDLSIDGVPLYKVVAHHVAQEWNTRGNCGLVVGATYPEELGEVRTIVGDMPLLIPGIGAQGGDLEKTIAAAKNSANTGMLISASRSIIYASNGDDYADAARNAAQKLDGEIRAAL